MVLCIFLLHFLFFGLLWSVELNDKFPAFQDKGSWLLKVYAPWCGHCKALEPIWKEATGKLRWENVHLQIGELDGSMYGSIAEGLGVHGFPTIIYIKNGVKTYFNNERNVENLLEFVRRLEASPLQEINNFDQFKKINHKIFFLFQTPSKDSIEFEKVKAIVESNRAHSYYYFTSTNSKVVEHLLTSSIQSTNDEKMKISYGNMLKNKENLNVINVKKTGILIGKQISYDIELINFILREKDHLLAPLSSMIIDEQKFFHRNLLLIVVMESGSLKKKLEKIVMKHLNELLEGNVRIYYIDSLSNTEQIDVIESLELSYFRLESNRVALYSYNVVTEKYLPMTFDNFDSMSNEFKNILSLDTPTNSKWNDHYTFSKKIYRPIFEVVKFISLLFNQNKLIGLLVVGGPLAFISCCIFICCSLPNEDNETFIPKGSDKQKTDNEMIKDEMNSYIVASSLEQIRRRYNAKNVEDNKEEN
ncbi:hypothetical protein SNEBB_006140 [Seison nebaliae]|nr:hypothetical protein SNEBB_006140 [Seison nebaliae]